MKQENEENGVLVEDTATQDEIDSATQSSKYLTTAPGYKSKFDVVDILTTGNIPVFENTADKMVCALELGRLIRKTGFGADTNNLVKFMAAVDLPHNTMLLKQLTLNQMYQAAHDDNLGPVFNQIAGVVSA